MRRTYFTQDSFGWNCPSNWQEIADHLNGVLDRFIEEGLEEDEIHDMSNEIWEAYCRDALPGAPEAVFED